MESSAVVSELDSDESPWVEHNNPDAYAFARQGKQFRHPRRSTAITKGPLRREAQIASELCGPEDQQLNDLIFSWRRLTDPKLKRLAIKIIQSMAA